MKKSVSLLSNLLVSSTLFWGVPVAQGEEIGSEESLKVPAVSSDYCHMQFPAMLEDNYPSRGRYLTRAQPIAPISDELPNFKNAARAPRNSIIRKIYQEQFAETPITP